MEELLISVSAKKEGLEAMRPASRAAMLALQKPCGIHLTYTCKAIEGTTLTCARRRSL
jgi:hypothetical protein